MAVVPKFDLSKEGFRVASFMSTTISSVVPKLFGNDSVSSRRQDEKVGYHLEKLCAVQWLLWLSDR